MFRTFLILILFIFPVSFYGQNKHASLGSKDYGICFGNSANYNGIRFNLLDKNVNNVNGLNVTGTSGLRIKSGDSVANINGLNITALYSTAKKINGISINVIGDSIGKSNGIALGGLGSWVDKSNGINVGGLFAKAQRSNGINASYITSLGVRQNGIAASLFFTKVESKLNGIGWANGVLAGDTLNGLSAGGFAVFSPYSDSGTGRISGLALSAIVVWTNKMNGMAASAAFNKFDTLHGVSVSTVNLTKQLHGFEFGLINHAGNNRKPFRWTPFFNFNLRRQHKQKSVA